MGPLFNVAMIMKIITLTTVTIIKTSVLVVFIYYSTIGFLILFSYARTPLPKIRNLPATHIHIHPHRMTEFNRKFLSLLSVQKSLFRLVSLYQIDLY